MQKKLKNFFYKNGLARVCRVFKKCFLIKKLNNMIRIKGFFYDYKYTLSLFFLFFLSTSLQYYHTTHPIIFFAIPHHVLNVLVILFVSFVHIDFYIHRIIRYHRIDNFVSIGMINLSLQHANNLYVQAMLVI